jgi:hypothetical protein
MTQGSWVDGDYYTWIAGALLAAIFLLPLTIETAVRLKSNLMWYSVVLAIVLNILKNSLVT